MEFSLSFNIQSYWHIGSGQEGGTYADALTLKTLQQLPYIPGKSIKGLLKEAFTLADNNLWLPDNMLALLFGIENADGTTKQGILQLSSAHLSNDETQFLIENPQAKSMLYKVTYATAIDEKTGVAKDTSLRSTEVSVPMSLKAQLSLATTHPNYSELDNDMFATLLPQVVTLITEIGAKRHRGLGRCTVKVEKTGEKS